MKSCLEAMQARLSDLLQSGLDTGGVDAAPAFSRLAQECESHGLHTGSTLMNRLAQLLDVRTHALEKQDGPLLDALFQTEHYITLCQERWQEIEIQRAWQRNQELEQETEGGTSV